MSNVQGGDKSGDPKKNYNLCLKTMFFYVVSSKFLTSNIFLDPQVGGPSLPPLRMYEKKTNLFCKNIG